MVAFQIFWKRIARIIYEETLEINAKVFILVNISFSSEIIFFLYPFHHAELASWGDIFLSVNIPYYTYS